MWIKCHLFGSTPDCDDTNAYQDFRHAVHDHRNATMAASGSIRREIRASHRMLRISTDAIAHLERLRDDAQSHQ
jgi:hypothetical protein